MVEKFMVSPESAKKGKMPRKSEKNLPSSLDSDQTFAEKNIFFHILIYVPSHLASPTLDRPGELLFCAVDNIGFLVVNQGDVT